MNTKDFSKMAILDQSVLQKAEKGRFFVDKDYNLNKARLVVPKGMTIDLSGGSINNGTIVLDDTLLENMSTGCIDAKVEGTISNKEIFTSHFSSANNLRLDDYSGLVINYDQDETITSTIILSGTNVNGNTNTVFNGQGHNFTCNETFFSIKYGSKNVTIKNFNAVANVSGKTFEEMVSSDGEMSGIHILNNIVDGFKIGISLNNDSGNDNNKVSYCTVSGNVIRNCPGSVSGSGYGIHLAKAQHCTITENEVVNCERHAIYHGYGEYNTISNNIIRNHCQNLTTYNLLAALEIGRKSNYVTVSGNTFTNCNNVCLLVYSPLSSNDSDGSTHPWRYGECKNIVIQNNGFYKGNLTGSIGNLPFIYIGVEGTPYSTLLTNNTVVKNVQILNNTFHKYGGENQKCIRIHQCEDLEIKSNSFLLGLPSSALTNDFLVIDIPNNYISGNVSSIKIEQNIFTYLTTGIGNLYLIGENMSFVTSSNSPYFTIDWKYNTLLNQTIGGNTMYQLSKYPLGNNFNYIP